MTNIFLKSLIIYQVRLGEAEAKVDELTAKLLDAQERIAVLTQQLQNVQEPPINRPRSTRGRRKATWEQLGPESKRQATSEIMESLRKVATERSATVPAITANITSR